MTCLRRRGLLLAGALSLVLAAPALAQAGPAERLALNRLAAGDTLGAVRLVREAQDRGAQTAGLERIRLTAERTGAGLRRLPLPLRRRRVVATAERLLALDPADPLALVTLADDAVATALFFRDRGPRIRSTGDATPAERQVRLRGSRFDIGQRTAVRPLLDRSGPGRDAARDATRHLDALLRLDPRAAAPLAVALAVSQRRWARVDSVADALRIADPVAAALYAGLAAWRLGRADEAGRAFAAALAALSPTERARLDDLTPLLSPDSLAAYRAGPEAFAQRFWARTDPRLLTEASERRTEHLTRVVEADLLFGRPLADLFSPRPRRGADTDRGRIYVRYGRPDRETGFTQDDAQPTYTRDAIAAYVVWEYDRLDAGAGSSRGDRAGARFVFDDPTRAGLYRTYSPPASAFAATAGAASADDYVAYSRDLQDRLPEAYVDTLATALRLVAARVRDPDGATTVIAAFAVPPDALAGLFADGAFVDQSDSGVALVRLGAAATLRAEVIDTTRTPSHVALATRDVTPLAPSGFALSDLLIVGGDGAGVQRGAAVLVPLASDTLDRAAPVAVYAEVYGLVARGGRTDATADVRFVPADARSGARRALDRLLGRRQRSGVAAAAEFQGAARTSVEETAEPLALSLDASGLPPGRYRLVLRVTDRHAGQTAETGLDVVLDD